MTSLKENVPNLWKYFMGSSLNYECGQGVDCVSENGEKGEEVLEEKGKDNKIRGMRKQNTQIRKMNDYNKFSFTNKYMFTSCV